MAAADLLQQPTFISVIQSLGVECFADFVESKPEQAERRDAAYNLYRGLQAIEAELNARVHQKEQAVARLDAEREQQEAMLEDTIFIQGDIDR